MKKDYLGVSLVCFCTKAFVCNRKCPNKVHTEREKVSTAALSQCNNYRQHWLYFSAYTMVWIGPFFRLNHHFVLNLQWPRRPLSRCGPVMLMLLYDFNDLSSFWNNLTFDLWKNDYLTLRPLTSVKMTIDLSDLWKVVIDLIYIWPHNQEKWAQ